MYLGQIRGVRVRVITPRGGKRGRLYQRVKDTLGRLDELRVHLAYDGPLGGDGLARILGAESGLVGLWQLVLAQSRARTASLSSLAFSIAASSRSYSASLVALASCTRRVRLAIGVTDVRSNVRVIL